MDQLKFFLQYLLVPLTIAGVGWFISTTQQASQRRLEEIKFTEQIIKDAYDTSNPARGFAICNLIKPVLQSNPAYADSLIESINNFYKSRIKNALEKGDIFAAKEIISASNAIGGDAAGTEKQAKENKVISKAEKARDFEEKGIQFLNENNLDSAKKAFENAEASYPGFHNVYEISKFLKTTKPEEIGSAKNIIKSKYLWGMNKTLN